MVAPESEGWNVMVLPFGASTRAWRKEPGPTLAEVVTTSVAAYAGVTPTVLKVSMNTIRKIAIE